MDSVKRRQLLSAIRQHGLPSTGGSLPVVSLEEFFGGNDDIRSIGRNLARHPGINRFFSILRKIRSRPDVQDVLIEIHEADESDEAAWPFSRQVFLVTTVPLRTVETWLLDLQPSEVKPGQSLPSGSPSPEAGYDVFAAWWE